MSRAVGVHHGCGMSWTPQTPAYAINNSIYFRSIVSLHHLSAWWFFAYPSEKYAKVSWDDDIPNIWKNKTCSEPPTSSPPVLKGDANPDTPSFCSHQRIGWTPSANSEGSETSSNSVAFFQQLRIAVGELKTTTMSIAKHPSTSQFHVYPRCFFVLHVFLSISHPNFNGNSRILKWRYCTI